MAKRSDSFSWASLFSRLTVLQNANVESEREFPPYLRWGGRKRAVNLRWRTVAKSNLTGSRLQARFGGVLQELERPRRELRRELLVHEQLAGGKCLDARGSRSK